MTKALWKKQMMEVFSWLYTDKKTGKLRTAKGIAGYVLLYLVIFGFLSVMFGVAAVMLCEPLLSVDMGWMYWCLMGSIAVFFGVFGSVFNTFASLYQAKDNDLLLAMPIPVRHILLVRLFGVYAMGLMYELMVMIPTLIIWFIHAPFSPLGTVCAVLIPLVLSVFVLVLSAVLGWVVALISGKLKHKNIITVIISLAFFVVYYYFSTQAYVLLEALVRNAQAVGGKIKIAMYPLYHMGLAAEGNLLSMLVFTGIIAALFLLVYWVMSRSFLKLATTNRGAAKAVYKEQKVNSRSVGGALLSKELRRFLGSANYMLNCGMGILFMPVAAGVLIWKAEAVRGFMAMIPQGYAPLIAVAAVCILSSMNDMSAPSVSLEGKNLWLLKSLPVSGSQALMAKLKLHLVLTLIPAAVLVVALEWVIQPEVLLAILIPVVSGLFILLMGSLGLTINLKTPNLNWTSEIVPIKQSVGVMIALLGGWAMVVGLAGLYIPLRNALSPAVYLAMVSGLLLVVDAVLIRWLMTKGARRFETL